MSEKLKQYESYLSYFEQFRDVRAIGLVIFLIIVLLISWSGVKAIQTNYDLQKQVSTLQQEDQVQELENKNLQLENEYLNTNQYLELTARQDFGLGAPGETELLVPKDVALANTVNLPGSSVLSKANSKLPFYERNFQAWMDFLFHRQSSND
jgi:cell division protein FtsL